MSASIAMTVITTAGSASVSTNELAIKDFGLSSLTLVNVKDEVLNQPLIIRLKKLLEQRGIVSSFLIELDDEDPHEVNIEIDNHMSLLDFMECMQKKNIPNLLFKQAVKTAHYLGIEDYMRLCEVYLDNFSMHYPDCNMFEAFVKYGHINYAYLTIKYNIGIYQDIVAQGARYGLLEVLQFAHQRGIDMFDAGIAAEYGHLECLQYIFTQNIEISDKAIDLAAKNGHLDCVKFLLEKGQKIDHDTITSSVNHLRCLEFLHSKGCTLYNNLMSVAAEIGNLDSLKYLYEHGCICDDISRMNAVKGGHMDCLLYLYDHGCLGNPQEEKKVAIINGHLECLKFLVNFSPADYIDSLTAAREGQVECLRYLYDQGCMGNPQQEKEIAIINGHLECLKFLVNFSPADYRDNLTAAKEGQVECLKFIHSRGGHLNELVMSFAAEKGNKKCLEFLCSAGCPWDERATQVAAGHNHFDCLIFLHTHGCPWDKGATTAAAGRGNLNILKYLHQYGCPWDKWTTAAAACCETTECLDYLRINECPWDEWASAEATSNGRYDNLVYLHTHGCPIGKYSLQVARDKRQRKCVEFIKSIL